MCTTLNILKYRTFIIRHYISSAIILNPSSMNAHCSLLDKNCTSLALITAHSAFIITPSLAIRTLGNSMWFDHTQCTVTELRCVLPSTTKEEIDFLQINSQQLVSVDMSVLARQRWSLVRIPSGSGIFFLAKNWASLLVFGTIYPIENCSKSCLILIQ